MEIEYSEEDGITGSWTDPREVYRFLGVKKKHPTRHLFRYSAVTEYLLDSLRRGYLWFSTPERLNDPFDSKVFIDYDLPSEDLRHRVEYVELQKMKKTGHLFFQDRSGEHGYAARLAIPASDFTNDVKGLNLMNNISALARRSQLADRLIGICSFTEDPRNMLMWSHYASSHTGVCLRFRHASAKGMPSCFPVKYARTVWKFRGNPADYRDFFTLQFKSVFRKSAVWSYEREWRALSFQHAGPAGYDLRNLDGVIFGLNTSDENRQRIVTAIGSNNYPNVKFYQAFHDPFRYRMYLIALHANMKAQPPPSECDTTTPEQ